MASHRSVAEPVFCGEIVISIVLKIPIYVEPVVIPQAPSCQPGDGATPPQVQCAQQPTAAPVTEPQANSHYPPVVFYQAFWVSLTAPLLALALAGLSELAVPHLCLNQPCAIEGRRAQVLVRSEQALW